MMLAGEPCSPNPPRQERDPDPQLEGASSTTAKGAALPSASPGMPGGLGLDQTWHSPSQSAAQDLLFPFSGMDWDTGVNVHRDKTEMTAGR